MRREATARDFYLGKLRHVTQACLCGAPNIPKIGRTLMFIRLLLPLAAVALFAHGAAFAQADPNDDSALYDMLLGEIAQQRGDYALAAKTYLELARRTRDPRIARRAVEVANQGRLNELALD